MPRLRCPSTHPSLPLRLPLPASLPRSNMLVAYNALLHFLGSLGELQRSLGVYRGMARVGPRPDVVTYNTLIAAAAGGGNVRVAMQVFSDMVDAGGCCAVVGMLCMLRACCVHAAGCVLLGAAGAGTAAVGAVALRRLHLSIAPPCPACRG